MSKILHMEGIPSPAAGIYSLIAKKNPIMRDVYRNVALEVTSRISSGLIIDIGTGPGYLPFEIAWLAPDQEIIGIDISPAMVKVARENAEERGLSDRVTFQVASAGDLPFDEDHIDLAVSTLSLHHWSHPAQYIAEIHRVLKNGGEAWIYDFRKDVPKEVKAQLRSRYGWWLSFVVHYIVRAHSSMKKNDAEKILSSPEIGFSSKNVVDKGILLKLQLIK
jgi:ubiquinone/menaquinone biosynthesis C-methylase UbiE